MRVSQLFHPFPIIIGLGSNLGPGLDMLRQAVALLEDSGVRVTARSPVYRSRAWGITDQPDFLNAAVAVKTALDPLDLLERMLYVEMRMGRRRELKWGPRNIDLDLLIYGSVRMNHPKLKLPHPHMAQRDFVLQPLIDLGAPPLGAPARTWIQQLEHLTQDRRTLTGTMNW